MEEKIPLFSITKKALRIDYYKGDGSGGQKKNKTANCCRITHLESNAVGKSEEGRSKEQNKQRAFKRMTETEDFKKWMKIKISRELGITAQIEKEVEKSMITENLKIEIRDKDGLWVEINYE